MNGHENLLHPTGEAWQAMHPAGNRGRPQRADGMAQSPEYDAYMQAKWRCTKVGNRVWADYGGRGIRFLFDSFEQFYSLLGARPEGLTLDRINNDGNYEPGNVRWADRSTQRLNQRGAV
jgi:hypothetical protein